MPDVEDDGFEKDEDIGRPEIFIHLRDAYGIDPGVASLIFSLVPDRRWAAFRQLAETFKRRIADTAMSAVDKDGKPMAHELLCVDHGRIAGISQLLDQAEAIAEDIKDSADGGEKG